MTSFKQAYENFNIAIVKSFDMQDWLEEHCGKFVSNVSCSKPYLLPDAQRRELWKAYKAEFGHLFSINIDSLVIKRGEGWKIINGGIFYSQMTGVQHEMIVEIEDETIAVAFRLALL